jgi:hypothetical protein
MIMMCTQSVYIVKCYSIVDLYKNLVIDFYIWRLYP